MCAVLYKFRVEDGRERATPLALVRLERRGTTFSTLRGLLSELGLTLVDLALLGEETPPPRHRPRMPPLGVASPSKGAAHRDAHTAGGEYGTKGPGAALTSGDRGGRRHAGWSRRGSASRPQCGQS
eukprot:scaffold108850_cov60-Phaeocystis_antarctica.AAC.3